MQKLIATLILLVVGSSLSFGQMSKVVSAYNYYGYFKNDGKIDDLIKAKTNIDLAIEHEKSKANAKTWYYRGMIYNELASQKDQPELSNNAVDLAYEAYSKSIELDSKRKYAKDALNGLTLIGNSFYQIGFNHYNNKEYDQAYDKFSKSLEINDLIAANNKKQSAFVDTITILATAYSAEKSGKATEAKAMYEKLVELNYKEEAIYQSLSRIYRAEGDEAKASEIMAKGRELFPNSKALIIDELNELLTAGKQDEAIGKLNEAIAIDPENPTLYFALGAAYDSQKELENAKTNYALAIEKNPEYFDAHYNLGAVYYNQAAEKTKEMNELPLDDQKNYDRLKAESDAFFTEALPFFEKALQINSGDRNTLIALKEIYARKGMNEQYQSVSDQLKSFE